MFRQILNYHNYLLQILFLYAIIYRVSLHQIVGQLKLAGKSEHHFWDLGNLTSEIRCPNLAIAVNGRHTKQAIISIMLCLETGQCHRDNTAEIRPIWADGKGEKSEVRAHSRARVICTGEKLLSGATRPLSNHWMGLEPDEQSLVQRNDYPEVFLVKELRQNSAYRWRENPWLS